MFILRTYVNALRKDISLCDDTRTLLCYYGGRGGGACLTLTLCCIFIYLSYFLKSYTLFLLSILTGIIYSIIIYQSIKLKNTLKKISNKCITMFVLGQEIIWHKKNFELSFLCFESYINYVCRN